VFLLATVMCFVGLILHCPPWWTMYLLLAETVLFTLLGSRLTVVAVFVMTAGGLARYGRPFRRRHLALGILLLAVLSVLVSSTRTYFGREMFATSVMDRVSNLRESAVSALDDSELDVKSDFIYRFDGNIFPTMVNEKFREGYSGVGLKSFANNFLTFIPSFFHPGKLDSGLEERNERAYADTHFGLPVEVDLPTTLFTVLFGYYGLAGLLCCAAVLGFVFAHLDQWVNSSTTPAAYCVGLALAYCCIFTEQGVEVYFATFRSAIVMLVLLRATSRLRLGEKIAKTPKVGQHLVGARDLR
jgi:hypothetical protein